MSLPSDFELEIESLPQCLRCQRFDRTSEGKMTCTVFPDGIPESILTNEHDHFKVPFPGDGGVLGEEVISELFQP